MMLASDTRLRGHWTGRLGISRCVVACLLCKSTSNPCRVLSFVVCTDLTTIRTMSSVDSQTRSLVAGCSILRRSRYASRPRLPVHAPLPPCGLARDTRYRASQKEPCPCRPRTCCELSATHRTMIPHHTHASGPPGYFHACPPPSTKPDGRRLVPLP